MEKTKDNKKREFTIRPALPKEYKKVARLELKNRTASGSSSGIHIQSIYRAAQTILTRPGHKILILETRKGQAVGTLTVSLSFDPFYSIHAEFQALYLTPKYRIRGLAATLVYRGMLDVMKQGAQIAVFNVFDTDGKFLSITSRYNFKNFGPGLMNIFLPTSSMYEEDPIKLAKLKKSFYKKELKNKVKYFKKEFKKNHDLQIVWNFEESEFNELLDRKDTINQFEGSKNIFNPVKELETEEFSIFLENLKSKINENIAPDSQFFGFIIQDDEVVAFIKVVNSFSFALGSYSVLFDTFTVRKRSFSNWKIFYAYSLCEIQREVVPRSQAVFLKVEASQDIKEIKSIENISNEMGIQRISVVKVVRPLSENLEKL